MLRPHLKTQATVLAAIAVLAVLAALRAVQMPMGQPENKRKRTEKQINDHII